MGSIPKTVWMFWHDLDLPARMLENVSRIRTANPDFECEVYNDESAKQFLKTHFPKEILEAYESLIPISYKCDLWRFCVLYIFGGIYVDIKLQSEGNFRYKDLTDQEYFCSDGTYMKNGKEYRSICTGIIAVKKHNVIMLQSIINIVHNVQTANYGDNPWHVTGPRLLGIQWGKHYTEKPLLRHIGQKPPSKIAYTRGDKTILTIYDGYKQERKTPYYVDLWKKREIFRPCSINLQRVYEQKEWPEEFLKHVKEYIH